MKLVYVRVLESDKLRVWFWTQVLAIQQRSQIGRVAGIFYFLLLYRITYAIKMSRYRIVTQTEVLHIRRPLSPLWKQNYLQVAKNTTESPQIEELSLRELCYNH